MDSKILYNFIDFKFNKKINFILNLNLKYID